MFPKKTYKKRLPTRKSRGVFSKETMIKIIERDVFCVVCGCEGQEIHHCKFKSQGGRGVYTNGVYVCRACHNKAHKHFEIAEMLRDIMIELYGVDYYKDSYDLK